MSQYMWRSIFEDLHEGNVLKPEIDYYTTRYYKHMNIYTIIEFIENFSLRKWLS